MLQELAESLTLLDAARAVRLHPATLRRAIRLKELDAIQIRPRILIRPADLEAWLERIQTPTVSGVADG